MPLLTLSDHDLVELHQYAMRHFRGDEINMLKEWISAKQRMQQQAERVASAREGSLSPPPTMQNGYGETGTPDA